MAMDGLTFGQWLRDAKIASGKLTAEQFAILGAGFRFLEQCCRDYCSVLLLSHFLLHCQVGSKVAQVVRYISECLRRIASWSNSPVCRLRYSHPDTEGPSYLKPDTPVARRVKMAVRLAHCSAHQTPIRGGPRWYNICRAANTGFHPFVAALECLGPAEDPRNQINPSAGQVCLTNYHEDVYGLGRIADDGQRP
jgi:hypothetical protein